MQAIGAIVEFIKTVAIIILVAFFVRFFLIQPFIVDGSSMEPNFHNGEYLFVDKISYRFRDIKRGDVIVFHPPTSPNVNYIKRVIALPGESVEIRNGEIYVNSARISEPYIPQDATTVKNSAATNIQQKMGFNEYFVLGDNRDHSSDSREWGKLPKENVIGRAWVVIFPIKDFGLVFHPTYALIPPIAQAVGE